MVNLPTVNLLAFSMFLTIYMYQAAAVPSKKNVDMELTRELVFPDHYPSFFSCRLWAFIQPECFSYVYEYIHTIQGGYSLLRISSDFMIFEFGQK